MAIPGLGKALSTLVPNQVRSHARSRATSAGASVARGLAGVASRFQALAASAGAVPNPASLVPSARLAKLPHVPPPGLTGVGAGAMSRFAQASRRMTQGLAQIARGEAGLSAEAVEAGAEQANELMKEEADVIQMIMESKNEAIGAVLRMMQQTSAAQLKLGQATASRG